MTTARIEGSGGAATTNSEPTPILPGGWSLHSMNSVWRSDRVSPGDDVVVVEPDKAIVSVPTPAVGEVLELLAHVDDELSTESPPLVRFADPQ